MRSTFLSLLMTTLLLTACFSPKNENFVDAEIEKSALLKIDNDFAKLSADKGLKNAYLDYIDSNVVLLRPNSLPIADADAVDYILAMDDTAYNITWKPSNADVAKLGDMGYSYGVYEINVPSQDTALYGTYITVWKKQADGKWKFVLQSNNEGVGE